MQLVRSLADDGVLYKCEYGKWLALKHDMTAATICDKKKRNTQHCYMRSNRRLHALIRNRAILLDP